MCRKELDCLMIPDISELAQGAYEMRSGSAEVAIEYLDQAIRTEPEDEMLFIMRCKCLIK